MFIILVGWLVGCKVFLTKAVVISYQAILEKYPCGQKRPPIDILPTQQAALQSTAV